MAEVEITGLTKRFGAVVAVDDVSLTLNDGELFGLLGPSGSGKTTLMRCVAGFVEPDAGRIKIGSVEIGGIPTHRRDIGMVFQNYALFPHLSVRDNIAFSLKVRGKRQLEIAERVGAMLSLVQLAGYEDRLPRQLSGGQQQRVALARAIISKPSVLLLDEPLNALDKRLRQQMQIELKQIQRDVGITSIFVTHDQDEALSLCDRIAIFKDGKIAQVGKPGETYERPRTAFAAEFLGAANFLRGRSLGREGGLGRISLEQGGVASTEDEIPPAGGPVTMVVRPEKLLIAPSAGPNEPGSAIGNQLEGVVEKIVYLGSSITYIARTPLGLMTVFQQNRNAPVLEPGASARISWLPSHAIVLAE